MNLLNEAAGKRLWFVDGAPRGYEGTVRVDYHGDHDQIWFVSDEGRHLNPKAVMEWGYMPPEDE